MVSVTSVPCCKLAQQCHMALQLPLERELCPFDMAPVTSTAIQLLWGDTLAIALMQVHSTCPAVGICSCSSDIWRKLHWLLAPWMAFYDHPAMGRLWGAISNTLDIIRCLSSGCRFCKTFGRGVGAADYDAGI